MSKITKPGKVKQTKMIDELKEMSPEVKSVMDDLRANTLHCTHCKSMVPKEKAIKRNASIYHEGELYKITHYNCPKCNSWMDSTHEKSETVSNHFDNETIVKLHSGKIEPKNDLLKNHRCMLDSAVTNIECDNCELEFTKQEAISKICYRDGIKINGVMHDIVEYRCPRCKSEYIRTLKPSQERIDMENSVTANENIYMRKSPFDNDGDISSISAAKDYKSRIDMIDALRYSMEESKRRGLDNDGDVMLDDKGNGIPAKLQTEKDPNIGVASVSSITEEAFMSRVEPRAVAELREEMRELVSETAKSILKEIRKDGKDNDGDIMIDNSESVLTEETEDESINTIVLHDIAQMEQFLEESSKAMIQEAQESLIPPNEKIYEKAAEASKVETQTRLNDKKKGFVIVVEGTDGSGKQTQATLLRDKLNELGVKATMYSFPNYESLTGKMVSQYLHGEFDGQGYINHHNDPVYRNSMLYSVDRMYGCMIKDAEGKTIIDRYNDGEVIIFDRYTQSNFIHQGIHFNDYELGQYVGNLEYLEYDFMGLPKPDMILYLKVSPETCMRNIEKRGREKDNHETLEHLTKVSKHVDRLIKECNWETIYCEGELLNNLFMKSKSDIHYNIMNIVKERLKEEGILEYNHCPNCFKLTWNEIQLQPVKISNAKVDKYNLAYCPRCGSIFDVDNL